MTIKKSLTALAFVAGVTAISASAPALAGPALPTVTSCPVTDVWTLPSLSAADACMKVLNDNITVSGGKAYTTNSLLAGWAPYSSGSWMHTANLSAGGLWDSLISLAAGETIDLMVFLKQGNDWGAYFFNDVNETSGGYNTSGYTGNGTGLSHGFVLAADRKGGDEFEVPVPEPASLALFGSALTALSLLRRRNSKA